ncbi:MAG: hypothetical protein ACFB9N_05405 [Geitlerinemataceae cyanobacterium]
MMTPRTLGLALAALAGLAAIGVQPATAQLSDEEALTSSAEDRRIRQLSIPETLDRAFFEHDRDAYENQTVGRQFESYLIDYTENEIERDGELVNVVLRDLLRQQALDSPPIRTADIANPFNSSLMTMPGAGFNPPVRGSEFVIP